MKQKVILVAVLAILISLLFAFKKGVFSSSSDAYVNLKLPDEVDYNFHIKPILSDKCYTCHGPDANKRKAGFRLDEEASTYSELPESPGEFPIVAGKPNKSKIYEHIVTDDADKLMPPPDSKLALNSYEKKLIKKWIQQGGKFEKHWAFMVPKKAKIPINKHKDWAQNEIDAFILNMLEDNELMPSPKASVESLIRRLSLDLTGLPPKKEAIEKLTANGSEAVIENVIDVFFGFTSLWRENDTDLA